jgi:hypothetical protein
MPNTASPPKGRPRVLTIHAESLLDGQSLHGQVTFGELERAEEACEAGTATPWQRRIVREWREKNYSEDFARPFNVLARRILSVMTPAQRRAATPPSGSHCRASGSRPTARHGSRRGANCASSGDGDRGDPDPDPDGLGRTCSAIDCDRSIEHLSPQARFCTEACAVADKRAREAREELAREAWEARQDAAEESQFDFYAWLLETEADGLPFSFPRRRRKAAVYA